MSAMLRLASIRSVTAPAAAAAASACSASASAAATAAASANAYTASNAQRAVEYGPHLPSQLHSHSAAVTSFGHRNSNINSRSYFSTSASTSASSASASTSAHAAAAAAASARAVILGIESSCDETAAAVLTTHGSLRAHSLLSQWPIHEQLGGVMPSVAAR